jgi:ADP-dependent NAD(P)H-hydrate dehydratase / NAD(P)H-hydrate epimerase
MEGRGESEAPGKGLELLTAAEMGRADQAAVKAGVPSLTLMESAGRAVADAARKLMPPGSRVLVLCGPGNNGGDGFVAARHLKRASYDVRLYLLGDKAALKGDAAEMARSWDGPVRAMDPDATESMHLVIDAMFGAGLSRPLDGVAASMVEAVNALGKPVIAVDVPSGLDGSTGFALGPVIQATHTVTFFRRKPGHLLMPGRALCGSTSVVDIGIPAAALGDIHPQTWANAPDLWLESLPRPALSVHKYERGHVVVVSGPAEATGAARLGARGALRIGAGLVTVVGSSAATAVNAVHLTAIMVHNVGSDRALAEFLSDTRRNAVLIGPGAGVATATTDTVRTVLASPAAAVLDADALTAFALSDKQGAEGVGFGFTNVRDRPGARREDLFEAIAERAAPVVITPHEGEFKRLFPSLEGGKRERARAAARTSGAVVILKGPDTVIAAPDGRAAINENAPPFLATAGSGDVLAGFVTGLLAQKMPAFEAACAAVWLHGACATSFGPGLIAEDLPECLPECLYDLEHYAGGPGSEGDQA